MKRLFKKIDRKEWIYQILFLVVLFIFYSFDKDSPKIEWSKFVFFLNYVLLAFIIGYVCLPLFFYTKKYLRFFLALALIFGFAYVMEEYVLERIFFSDRRGKYVSNVFYTLLDIVPLVLTMVGFKLALDAITKQVEVEQLRSSIKESELRFLKSQINPHFLFNNLNNLYSHAIESSPKTPSIILELSSVLRYMLYDCKEDFVSLKKEIEHLKHFTALNELQIEDRGKVSFSTSAIPDNYVIAPLILMVFIENAFKHSTASQSDHIVIDIHIDIEESGVLNFKCSNSFLPNANNESLSEGIGLENVKKRLKILYPNQHDLSVAESNNVYNVNLTLYLQSNT